MCGSGRQGMMTLCSGEHTERTGRAGRTVEPEGRTGGRSRTPRDPHTERRGGTPRDRVRPQLQNGSADRTDGSRRRRGLPLQERPKSPRNARPGGAPPDPTREEPNGGVTSGRAVPSTELPAPTTTPDIDLTRSVGDAAGSSTRARQRGRPHLIGSGTTAPNGSGPHRRRPQAEGSPPPRAAEVTAERRAGRSAAGPNQVRSRPTADPGSCGPPDRA